MRMSTFARDKIAGVWPFVRHDMTTKRRHADRHVISFIAGTDGNKATSINDKRDLHFDVKGFFLECLLG